MSQEYLDLESPKKLLFDQLNQIQEHKKTTKYFQQQLKEELLVKNNTLAKENNFLEKDILSKQKNDVHAEKFAREELNLIYEDEDFLRFKEVNPNEPQQ